MPPSSKNPLVTIIASPLSILGKFCIPTGEHRGRPSGAIAPRSSVRTKITILVTQRGRDNPLHKVAYYCVFSSCKIPKWHKTPRIEEAFNIPVRLTEQTASREILVKFMSK
jgi:hypothetical protein